MDFEIRDRRATTNEHPMGPMMTRARDHARHMLAVIGDAFDVVPDEDRDHDDHRR